MHTRLTYRFKNCIEVEEYASANYGAPGEKRSKRRKATPEEIAMVNQYHKEKRCRHKLRQYFEKNDYLATLTYRIHERPADMAECLKHFRCFIQKLRRRFAKAGKDLRWIRNIEVGSRGAWHIHIAVKRIPDIDIMIRELWPYGKVDFQLLYEQGGFGKLAKYLAKSPVNEPRLKETSYATSRNMPIRPPKKEKIKWRDKIPHRNGFYLDKESYHEGINPVTGRRYRRYTFLRSVRD